MDFCEKDKHAEEDQGFHAYVEELLSLDLPAKEFIHQFPRFTGAVNLGRYLALYELYKQTLGVLGHIAEIGIWKGASFLFFAKLVKLFEPQAMTLVHGFEWFKGMEYQDEVDTGRPPAPYDADQALLQRLIDLQGLTNLALVHNMDVAAGLEGFLDEHPSLQFKLVFLDCPAGAVIRTCLTHLWPRVTRGGVMVFDHANNAEVPQEQQAIRDLLGEVKLRTFPFCRTPTGYLVKE